MKNIRHAIFETNSSSQHSIAVLNRDDKYTEEEIRESLHMFDETDSEATFFDGDEMHYGSWPFDILNKFDDKFKYAIASFCEYLEQEDKEKAFNEIFSVLQEILPQIKALNLPRDYYNAYYRKEDNTEIDVYGDNIDIKQDDGETLYYIDSSGNRHEVECQGMESVVYGSIDHQSFGLLQSFLENENISLKDFLINKKYVVIIDGDEYQTWRRYKDAGIINTAIIVKEYPTHDDGSVCAYELQQYNAEEKLKSSFD